MEDFQQLIRSKCDVFKVLTMEMRHAEQTGIFNWRSAMSVLRTEEKFCRHGISPFMDGYFAAIFDLLQMYECKETEVWNNIVRTFCCTRLKCFTDRIMKNDYYYFDSDYDFDSYPCQKLLNRADIRGLRFLLESGVPYLGLNNAGTFFKFPMCPLENIMENGVLSPEKRRRLIISRFCYMFLEYLGGPILDESADIAPGLNDDPSTTVWMRSTDFHFTVFEGDIDDEECIRQVPETFLGHIGDWKFPSNHIRCYRMVFNTIPEPIVTHDELKAVVRAFKGKHRTRDRIYSVIIRKFSKIFPECTGSKSPRSLKHLSKCRLRQNIRMSRHFPNSVLFSEAARSLPLPKLLQDYVLDIDDSVIYN